MPGSTKMSRRLSILALSVSLGLPTAVGVTEVCATKFDQAWADRVHQILAWNRAHPAYVKKHHLDRDMSAHTRRSKEWLRKQLEVLCGRDDDGLLIVDISGNLLDNEYAWMGHSGGDNSDPFHGLGDGEYVEAGQTLDREEMPVYGDSNVVSNSVDGYGYYTGFYPGYFPIVQSGGGYPPSIPLGPPVSDPVDPIAPAPEPSTVVLLATGVLGMCRKRFMR